MKYALALVFIGLVSSCASVNKVESVREPQQVIGEVGNTLRYSNLSCENAYIARSEKKEIANRRWRTLPAAVFTGGLIFLNRIDNPSSGSQYPNNTYTHVLGAIVAASQNKLTDLLLAALSDEIDLDSYSNTQQNKIVTEAINYINAENSSGRLCRNSDGKLETMKHNQLVKNIAAHLRLGTK